MNNETKSTEKTREEEKTKRLLEAKESFRKMQEEIAPFIRQRKFKEYSTAGEWYETRVSID
jgi:hypothetical protein